jgi:DNA repair exonuclease SbcCD nuclease subunit
MDIPAKRIWLITDTHFGVRSNSREWMNMIEDYFNNFFIPLLKKEYRPGDILIHCGDTFDSRQSLNIYVLNKAQEIFENISDILPVYIIVGNHDIFLKYSNEINSMKVFKHMKNITVFEQPQRINFGSKTGMLLPWVEDHEELTTFVQNPANKADILFCHADVKGVSFNRHVKIEEGTDAISFQQYDKVYSGHIHYAQKFKNVRMLGTPYQLTRSDAGNPKSIWRLDLETNEEQSWENVRSPKFLKYKIEWILEQSIERLQEAFFNNYVDILISPQWSLKFPFATFVEQFYGYQKINHIIVTDDELVEVDGEEGIAEEISLLKMIEHYVDATAYNEGIKDKLKSVSIGMYHEMLSILEDKSRNEE